MSARNIKKEKRSVKSGNRKRTVEHRKESGELLCVPVGYTATIDEFGTVDLSQELLCGRVW
ncbi:MAG: hypothetical protein WC889_15485 [Myxococcota bacterium]|jgi:hypothetical protein